MRKTALTLVTLVVPKGDVANVSLSAPSVSFILEQFAAGRVNTLCSIMGAGVQSSGC